MADGMDASPAYAKGKLAHELREIPMKFSKAELSRANLSLLQASTYERASRRASGQGGRISG